MLRRLWPAALALVVGFAPAAAAVDLVVEAPPELAVEARRIEAVPSERLEAIARLIGVEESGRPIRVILAGPDSEQARSAPAWVSGYAYSTLGVVVLFPHRTPNYPDSSLEELLRHEVAHVLIDRAAGSRPLPRWFNEGLAMVAGGRWSLDDRSRLTFALLVGAEVPLAELNARFAGDSGEVRAAYAVSGAFIRDLLQRYGSDTAAEILELVAIGMTFHEAFARATGRRLRVAEASFWRRHSFWYRWVPVLASSSTLWLGIAVLAVVAGLKRRRRAAELEAMWLEEEEREAERLDQTIH